MPERKLVFPAIFALALILVFLDLSPWSKGVFALLPSQVKIYILAALLFLAFVYIVRYAGDISTPGQPMAFEELKTGSYYLEGAVREIETRTLLLTEVKNTEKSLRKYTVTEIRAVRVPEKRIITKVLTPGTTIHVCMEPNGRAGEKVKVLK